MTRPTYQSHLAPLRPRGAPIQTSAYDESTESETIILVLKLYDYAASANCYKARLLLAQLGPQGFIGTCGSLAWLAPMLGIDTVAVYANDRFLASHIFFATHVYRQNGAANFDTLDLRGVMDVDLMAASEPLVVAGRPQ